MLHLAKTLTADSVKRLDLDFQQAEHLSGYELMCRAASACVHLIEARFNPQHSLVLCGGGNNGGDGWQIATILQLSGQSVEVISTLPPAQLKGDAALAFQAADKAGVPWEIWSGEPLPRCDLIVDAVLGIGFIPPLKRSIAPLIADLNALPIPVLSVDCPSGLAVDTGDASQSVKATLTATFLAHKPGLLTGGGKVAAGELQRFDLGCNERFVAGYPSPTEWLVGIEDLPARALDHYKHRGGHVLVYGGARNLAGAAILSAEAALFSGAGMVTLATDSMGQQAINSRSPEVMVCPHVDVAELKGRLGAFAIGPGLEPGELDLVSLLADMGCPAVFDAGALRWLSANPCKRNDWVLTPHTGEAADLLQLTTQDINRDRLGAARQIQAKYGGVVVLKGPGTIVCDDERCIINSSGNPALGVAGAGDILSGIIASFLAQGLKSFEAAAVAVYWHGRAADLWRDQQGGVRGLKVSELLPIIRRQINGVEERPCG